MKELERRKFLIRGALTMGSLPLQALVTGLPFGFLSALSRPSYAQTDVPALSDPQYLIMSLSSRGDPVNTNAPGSYAADPNDNNDPFNKLIHPMVAEVGPDAEGFENPVEFTLGSQTVKAAKPWANLDADLRKQFAFWHHGTFVNAHPEFGAARTINGAVRSLAGNTQEELPTMIAEHTRDSLGCITQETMTVGGSTTTSGGRPLPSVAPKELSRLFAGSGNSLQRMVSMRDQFVDKLYTQVKQTGTPAEKRFFDRYAKSKAEAATMGDSLGALISGVKNNSISDQIKCAVALIQLNIAPVIAIGMDFSGDNHPDGTLGREVDKTISSIGHINELWRALKQANLEDRVTMASLNTFGRNMYRNSRGGRDHNGVHHAMFIFGKNVKGGVIGGTEVYNKKGKGLDLRATGINSSGNQDKKHDIAFEDSFTSIGKTLCKAVGLENDTINERINGGKIITGALVG